MAPLILGYWGVRGLGAHIRYLLEHAGVQYEYKNWSDFPDPMEWFKQKYTLGFDYPNLPYLIDGDVKVTQSNAVMRYLGRKLGYYAPSDEKSQIEQDILDGLLYDFRVGIGSTVYSSENFEADKKKLYDDRLSGTLKLLDTKLGSRKYLMGDKLNYNDFHLFEILELLEKVYEGKILNEFKNLKRFHDEFAELKGVKEFLASGKNFDNFFGPLAKNKL